MLRDRFILGVVLLLTISCFSQTKNPLIAKDLTEQQAWVDSIYDGMTLKEKIGQLFMVDVFSRDPKSVTDAVKTLILFFSAFSFCSKHRRPCNTWALHRIRINFPKRVHESSRLHRDAYRQR